MSSTTINHQQTYSILVKNLPGALTKIAQLFYRRGRNIDTLTVGKTHLPDISKILISVNMKPRVAEQVRRQIENQLDVVYAHLLDRSSCLVTEICLLRVKMETHEDREGVLNHAQPYRPKVQLIDSDSMVLEVAATPEVVDAFVATMEHFQILDVSRTGITAMAKATNSFQLHNLETTEPEDDMNLQDNQGTSREADH